MSEICKVRVPGSKSVAQRAQILRSIYRREGSLTTLLGLPACSDVIELGAALQQFESKRGNWHADDIYYLGNGGTSVRFFTALCASTPGFEGMIDCGTQMRRRPILTLLDALRQGGADISCDDPKNLYPIRVKGKRLNGENIMVGNAESSQYMSALLMAEELWNTPLIYDQLPSPSRPYVVMTRRMISQFKQLPEYYQIEEDWSAASYFYEFALLNPGTEIYIDSLKSPQKSLQGDSRCIDIFSAIGVKSEFMEDGALRIHGDAAQTEQLKATARNSGSAVEIDMGDVPDLVPALAVALGVGEIPFRLANTQSLRFKESDRIAALQEEMAKIGVSLSYCDGVLSGTGRRELVSDKRREDGREKLSQKKIIIDSHADHRIAMAFSIAKSVIPVIQVADMECVSKSFPNFVGELGKL